MYTVFYVRNLGCGSAHSVSLNRQHIWLRGRAARRCIHYKEHYEQRFKVLDISSHLSHLYYYASCLRTICKQSIVRSDKPIAWTRYYLNPSYSEFVYIHYRHFVYHRSHEYYRNLPGTMCITCLEKHTTIVSTMCRDRVEVIWWCSFHVWVGIEF